MPAPAEDAQLPRLTAPRSGTVRVTSSRLDADRLALLWASRQDRLVLAQPDSDEALLPRRPQIAPARNCLRALL